jgi:hypothetical protein
MIIWGFASYKIAKMVKENEGLDIKPINYALLSVVCSFLFSMGMLFNKLGKFKNSTNMRVASMIAIVFAVILNIVMLF